MKKETEISIGQVTLNLYFSHYSFYNQLLCKKKVCNVSSGDNILDADKDWFSKPNKGIAKIQEICECRGKLMVIQLAMKSLAKDYFIRILECNKQNSFPEK